MATAVLFFVFFVCTVCVLLLLVWLCAGVLVALAFVVFVLLQGAQETQEARAQVIADLLLCFLCCFYFALKSSRDERDTISRHRGFVF